MNSSSTVVVPRLQYNRLVLSCSVQGLGLRRLYSIRVSAEESDGIFFPENATD